MTAYLKDPNLIHHNLEVSFVGEMGDDVGGITQEALRKFWIAFCDTYCEGHLQMIPTVNHR